MMCPMRSLAVHGSARSIRSVSVAVTLVVMVGLLGGCLANRGDISQVVKIDQTDVGGWHYDYFENRAYPCSISGFQTFAIGTKVGS